MDQKGRVPICLQTGIGIGKSASNGPLFFLTVWMVQQRGKVKSHPPKFFLFISQPERISGRGLWCGTWPVLDRLLILFSPVPPIFFPNLIIFPLFFFFCELLYDILQFYLLIFYFLFHFVQIFWLDICFHVLPYSIGVARLVDFEGNPFLLAAHWKKVSVVGWDVESWCTCSFERRDIKVIGELRFGSVVMKMIPHVVSGTPLWGPCNELENGCHPL